MVQNKALILAESVVGKPEEGKHLIIKGRDFDTDQAPPPGGVTTKNYYLSFDPYQRGRMRPPTIASYNAAFKTGEPITNRGIAKILKSDNAKFTSGDIVIFSDSLPTEEYSAIPKDVTDRATKLHNPYKLDPKLFIGALGMPGLTAYAAFYEIGKPKRGETIFISSAAGAVGQIVGQLAKREGLKVIGSVGDERKREWIVNDLGFDAAFNYRDEKPGEALSRLAPDGIDIYFENVGGEQLEAAINAMNNFGRIIACGMISQYGIKPEEVWPLRNIAQVVGKRITMRGFIVIDPDMGPKYTDEHQEKMQKWLADGEVVAKSEVTVGIDNAARGFIGMLEGKNFGKALLQIADLNE